MKVEFQRILDVKNVSLIELIDEWERIDFLYSFQDVEDNPDLEAYFYTIYDEIQLRDPSYFK
jgi:hypothetical protein